MPFVIESPARDAKGEHVGTFRVYVATEARAKEIADAHPERTYRAIALADMPEKARANLIQATSGA